MSLNPSVIRDCYFTFDVNNSGWIHPSTVEFLEKFRETESFKKIKSTDENDYHRLLESQVQAIKEIGISLTRQCPQAWNELMVVALGVPEDEPIPYLNDQA